MYVTKVYRRTNPKTVRGAKKKGWHVVDVPNRYLENHNVSWMGLEMWACHKTKGNFVTCFPNRQFAFELVEDASWFTMKWCI